MGVLHDKMLMIMQMKNLSPKTIYSYMHHMKSYVRMFGRSPDELGQEEICKYLHSLRNDRHLSWSNVNVGYSALRLFYVQVLNRDWSTYKIPKPKKETKLPVVLSKEEVRSIIDHTTNLKYRTILMTIYSAGLRLNEATHLKISDIDSKRMQIRVRQGKGKKDRYTLLSKTLLTTLRKYYKFYRPKEYLFESKIKDNYPLCITTIQHIFKKAKKKLELSNRLLSTPYVTPLLLIY